MSSGYNSTPEWPSVQDLDESYREVFRSELYEAKLKPLDYPIARWYYAGSDASHYDLFLESLQDTTKKPRVSATFGQVERVIA
jgi:hypothetical protein